MTLAAYLPDDPHARAMTAAHRTDEQRRAAAYRAAQAGDLEGLWEIMLAFQAVSGRRLPTATLRTYRQGLEAWLTWSGERGVSLLRPARAGPLYLGDMRARGLSVATIRVRVAAVRKLYAALSDAGVNTPDPMAGLRLPHDPTPSVEKHPPYTPEEVQAMLSRAEGGDAALILLCAHAGLRIQEALGLEWADVNLDKKIARVNGKGGRVRNVPLSTPTVDALRGLPAGSAFVLPVRAYTTVYDRIGRLAEAAGVAWRGFHAGRKHAGTQLYQHVPLEHVQRLLGHSSPADTLRYVQIGGSPTRDAVTALWG